MISWISERLFGTDPHAGYDSRVVKRLQRRLADGSRSAQGLCEAFAQELEASAVVVEQLPNDFVIVAGSPWKPTLQALDRLALDICFRTAEIAGAGSNSSAGSDWLFVPVCVNRTVVSAIGLAGRFCRRRFDPADDPSIPVFKKAMEDIYWIAGREVRAIASS